MEVIYYCDIFSLVESDVENIDIVDRIKHKPWKCSVLIFIDNQHIIINSWGIPSFVKDLENKDTVIEIQRR